MRCMQSIRGPETDGRRTTSAGARTKEVLKAMQIEIVEQAGLEADDLLGTISVKCEAEGLDGLLFPGIGTLCSLLQNM